MARPLLRRYDTCLTILTRLEPRATLSVRPRAEMMSVRYFVLSPGKQLNHHSTESIMEESQQSTLRAQSARKPRAHCSLPHCCVPSIGFDNGQIQAALLTQVDAIVSRGSAPVVQSHLITDIEILAGMLARLSARRMPSSRSVVLHRRVARHVPCVETLYHVNKSLNYSMPMFLV